MKIAVIGTGWVTALHLESLKNVPEIEVVGVCGRNLGRIAELSRGTAITAYTDYKEMIAKEKPDGVYLTLPPHLHGEVESFLADHVKAVLVEKPVTNSAEVGEAALDAFRRAGTLVSVAYQNRYRAAAIRARDFFRPSPDKPALVTGWWVGEMPPPLWWRNKALSGGQFVEQCTHVVDLARFIVGEVREVQAYGTSAFRTDASVTVEDAVTVNTSFVSGAIGTFATGCFTADGYPSPGIGLTIASRTATVTFSGWSFEASLRQRDSTQTFPPEENIFEIQALAFLQAWKTGDRSLILSDYADGLASLKVGLAADESVRTGNCVRL